MQRDNRRKQRLKERVARNPKHVRFENLDNLLRAYGFEVRQPRGGSSHYRYVRGHWQITAPFRRPFVNEHYVKEVLKLLEEVEAHEAQAAKEDRAR